MHSAHQRATEIIRLLCFSAESHITEQAWATVGTVRALMWALLLLLQVLA